MTVAGLFLQLLGAPGSNRLVHASPNVMMLA
jgi:hypothetical protein